MHEEDNNKHALQWFLNDIFELHKKEVEKNIIIAKLDGFSLYNREYDILELIKSLDIKKEEWFNWIKGEVDLSDDLIQQIEETFSD